MKKLNYYVFITLSLFSLATCQIDNGSNIQMNSNGADGAQGKIIKGEGNVVFKNIMMGDFIGIEISGSSTISLSNSNESKIRIEEFENLIEQWEIKVENKVLTIKVVDSVQLQNSLAMIDIQTKENIKNISIKGSSSMKINSGIENISTVAVNGSGTMELIGKTKTNQCQIDIKGSGDINFLNILAKSSVCKLNGSGSIGIGAQDSLAVEINGSGKVSYLGDPKVVTKVTGSGKVIKL